jgi:anti-sigma factor (TIGR02949 family)
MALTCIDLQRLVHPYLDGEFADDDRVALQGHIAVCSPCRDLVQHELAFKDRLRGKLRVPEAPPALRSRICAALDDADGAARPAAGARWQWLLPGTALASAAAAIALFVASPSLPPAATPARPVAASAPAERAMVAAPAVPQTAARLDQELVRVHENVPVELHGRLPEVASQLTRAVGRPVQLPRFEGRRVAFQRAWVHPLQGREAARGEYTFEAAGRRHRLTYVMFDGAGLTIGGTQQRRIAGRDIWSGHSGGVSFAAFADRGTIHAFVSDTDPDTLLGLVEHELGGR